MAGINYALISISSRLLSTQLHVESINLQIKNNKVLLLKIDKLSSRGFLRDHQRLSSSKSTDDNVSPRIQEFRKKLRERAPIEKLDELEEGKHPHQEKEPLKPFPDNINPETGETGGPRGPEPTRYGDWERKGRVTDF